MTGSISLIEECPLDASLVFDGRTVVLPPGSNKPADNQFQGTEYEKLCETACRECYDSFGKGRSSEALHEHVLDVINLSVVEHANPTIHLDLKEKDCADAYRALSNRKGIWIEPVADGLELTANFRAILEWDRWTNTTNDIPIGHVIGETLWAHGAGLAPMIFKKREASGPLIPSDLLTENLNEDQIWISLWLYGSRGFSHEQVRHRFAISQRSTRYVDESGSPYIEHPLITKYLNDASVDDRERHVAQAAMQAAMAADRAAYDDLVAKLEAYGKKAGLDATSARKQARGAARGSLGNALATSMIYSSNITGWKWILKNRKNKLADAEIREIYSPGLEALKSSQYGDRFSEFELIPSPDGIGTVLAA